MTELMQEFEAAFAAIKQELGFEVTLDQLDDIFFLREFIAKEGFVSNKLSRAICSRIVSTYSLHINYLHALVVPNPNSMIQMNEAQSLSEEQKKDIMDTMSTLMAFVSQNVVIGIKQDKEQEKAFIDGSVTLWEELKEKLLDYSQTISQYWLNQPDSDNE